MSFLTLHDLLHHKQVEHEDVKCITCYTRFASMEAKILHDNMNKFPCPDCERMFCKQSMLINHAKTHRHSGTKDHVCQTCGKGFALRMTWTCLKFMMKTETFTYLCGATYT